MNIINFIKSIFGVKPKEKTHTFYLDVLPDTEVVVNELNQVTLKIGDDITPKIEEPEKPKKKRYRKKKTNTKEAEAPKEVTPTKTIKDGTKPKTNKPKTPRQNPSV
jgi:hypothetical protein